MVALSTFAMNALPANAKFLIRRCTRWYRKGNRAVNGGDIDLSSKQRRGNRSFRITLDVEALSLKSVVRRDFDFHQQVARRATETTCFALSGQAQYLSRLRTGRNRD